MSCVRASIGDFSIFVRQESVSGSRRQKKRAKFAAKKLTARTAKSRNYFHCENVKEPLLFYYCACPDGLFLPRSPQTRIKENMISIESERESLAFPRTKGAFALAVLGWVSSPLLTRGVFCLFMPPILFSPPSSFLCSVINY